MKIITYTSSSPAGHGAPKVNDGLLASEVLQGCLSATTGIATPHLGSEAASSDPIPWSIDRMSWEDFTPSAWFCGVCEII